MENKIWKIVTELQQGDITKNEAVSKLLLLHDVSGELPSDLVPNLFVSMAQQIHYESVIMGQDMKNITECFNELQEAYKKERGNFR